MLGLDVLEFLYLVFSMNHVRFGLKRCLVGLVVVAAGGMLELVAATAPVFGDLRGTYRGVGTIVIKKNGTRRQVSAPVTVVNRLSRGKKTLQIATEGRFVRGNRSGRIRSNYSLAGKGRAILRLRDEANRESLRGRGTANLRRTGGKFTMRATGYGLKGIVTGKVRLRGNTLRIRQVLRDGTDSVTFSYLVNRRGKR